MFGATGNIGRHVVDQLLAACHIVTAYVEKPGQAQEHTPEPHRHRSRLDDLGRIARAVDGADAVIRALGLTLRRSATGTPVADGTSNIVEAMRAARVRRLIGLATPSVADSRDRPTLKAKVLPVMAGLAFPQRPRRARPYD